jgi:large subunit ribosomal protein L21
MIAVIKTGGKQYVVEEGTILSIEKLEAKEGDTVEFVTMLTNDKELKIGTPLTGKVTAKVLEQGRGKKISVIKYKPKARYRRNVGHRQPFTKVQIEKISA